MLLRTSFAGAAAALALAAAPGALAQTAAATSAAAPPSAMDFKTGAVVKDTDGVAIGTVVKAGRASDGKVAVLVTIDGKDVSLPVNLFTVAGDSVVSSATKAQIQAAIPPG